MEKLWVQNRQKELIDQKLEKEIIDLKKNWAFEKMQFKQRSDQKFFTKKLGILNLIILI